jgi:hypothetical protein
VTHTLAILTGFRKPLTSAIMAAIVYSPLAA